MFIEDKLMSTRYFWMKELFIFYEKINRRHDVEEEKNNQKTYFILERPAPELANNQKRKRSRKDFSVLQP